MCIKVTYVQTAKTIVGNMCLASNKSNITVCICGLIQVLILSVVYTYSIVQYNTIIMEYCWREKP